MGSNPTLSATPASRLPFLLRSPGSRLGALASVGSVRASVASGPGARILFEELIRRFSGISNETAGEHFTRREVIRLIVDLLIANDDAKLAGRGIIRPVYDPACGTGGRLALTEEGLTEFNPNIRVELFGCEIPDAARAEILRLYADFVNGAAANPRSPRSSGPLSSATARSRSNARSSSTSRSMMNAWSGSRTRVKKAILSPLSERDEVAG